MYEEKLCIFANIHIYKLEAIKYLAFLLKNDFTYYQNICLIISLDTALTWPPSPYVLTLIPIILSGPFCHSRVLVEPPPPSVCLISLATSQLLKCVHWDMIELWRVHTEQWGGVCFLCWDAEAETVLTDRRTVLTAEQIWPPCGPFLEKSHLSPSVTHVQTGEVRGITLISCLCARWTTEARVYTPSYE